MSIRSYWTLRRIAGAIGKAGFRQGPQIQKMQVENGHETELSYKSKGKLGFEAGRIEATSIAQAIANPRGLKVRIINGDGRPKRQVFHKS